MKVKVVNRSPFPLPAYQTELAAGLDLKAVLKETVVLLPLERRLIPTGIFLELPAGPEVQIRSRSGLALNSGITVLNSPGTSDADYRGEVQVLTVNMSSKEVSIEHGERIAHMVIARHENVVWELAQELTATEQGGGYGSTGIR